MRLVELKNVASRKVEQLVSCLRKPVQKITKAIINDLQEMLTAWLLC